MPVTNAKQFLSQTNPFKVLPSANLERLASLPSTFVAKRNRLSRTAGLILCALFSVTLPSFGSEHHSASPRRIFVVLRFDDVGVGSKLDQLTPVLSAMDAVGAPYTLGVIPSGISDAPKIVALLKRLADRGMDLAL